MWHRKREDPNVGDDIDNGVSVPKGIAVYTLGRLDGLVPVCIDRYTLEDGSEHGSDGPTNDDEHGHIAHASEHFAGEDAQVEEEQ